MKINELSRVLIQYREQKRLINRIQDDAVPKMWCCCRSIVKLHFTSVDVTVDKVEWRLFLWDNLWYFLLYFFCLYFYGYFGRMLFFVYISSGATSSPFPTLRSLPFSSLSKQMHLGLFHMNASLISKCNFLSTRLKLGENV